MNKPSKCKNCQWYGKPYWCVINPCDNCDKEDYYKVMGTYYTEDYVKSLLQQITQLTNNWNELEEWIMQEVKDEKPDLYFQVLRKIDILEKMEEIQNGSDSQ